jgi:hypothetical protein
MGEPKGDQPNPQPQEPTVGEPAEPTAADAAAPANIETTTVAGLPQPEPVVATAPAAIPEPSPAVASEPAPIASPEPAPVAAMVEAPKLDGAIAAPAKPQPIDVGPADPRSDETIEAGGAPSLLSGWTTSLSLERARRLAPLAASLAIAAVLGAIAGSLATGLGGASEPVAQSADARAVTQQVARLHAEIAALKTSIDGSAKSASAQLIKLGDRLDRFEKTQAEPAARLAKLAEAVDRIERRTPTPSLAAAAAHDITGSVTALAPAPQLGAAPETRPASPAVLEGWRVRSVYNGAALIQARAGGVMEVEPGDNLPGLGRIEAIRRQDGRWVVVTSKGVILTR